MNGKYLIYEAELSTANLYDKDFYKDVNVSLAFTTSELLFNID